MTTIAWDGKTLAADQCSWSGGVRRRVRKVFKIQSKERGPLLVAFTGHGSFCSQVLDWMRGERDRPNPSDYYGREDITRQCAIVIDSERRVWSLGNDLHWEPTRESIYANGAGQEFAWGALEAGATAVQAIEITAKRSDYAGFGVDSVTFEDTDKE
jgi:hypothetical protein